MSDHDPVTKPSHYTWHPSGIQPIEISEWCSFNVGTAINYIWRHAHKGQPVQDLRKAAWHLRREIERLQKYPGAVSCGPSSSVCSVSIEVICEGYSFPARKALERIWQIYAGKSAEQCIELLSIAATYCEGHANYLEDPDANK
jgi:hypothetical protein